jgi:hypothetical protein
MDQHTHLVGPGISLKRRGAERVSGCRSSYAHATRGDVPRAGALHEAVRQELLGDVVVQLLHPVLEQQLLVQQLVEDALRDGGLLGRGRAAELVEADPEPLVDALVDGVVLVADLARLQLLLQRLGLRGRPVLVRAAHVDHCATAAAVRVRERSEAQ